MRIGQQHSQSEWPRKQRHTTLYLACICIFVSLLQGHKDENLLTRSNYIVGLGVCKKQQCQTSVALVCGIRASGTAGYANIHTETYFEVSYCLCKLRKSNFDVGKIRHYFHYIRKQVFRRRWKSSKYPKFETTSTVF